MNISTHFDFCNVLYTPCLPFRDFARVTPAPCICMVACNGADPTTVGMCVCISLATGLILSIIIGRFEFVCKGEAFKKDSGLAVAPGMAVVMIVLLIKFLIGTVIV